MHRPRLLALTADYHILRRMLDSMTLDQLRILVAVVDAGSFTAASRRLGRVQSAVSQAIQALETTLGLALFDRSGKRPLLTDAGRIVVEDARRLIEAAQGLRSKAEAIGNGLEPELTLAVDPLLPIDLLTESLRALGQAFPTLPVRILTEALGAPESHLRNATVRIAIYATQMTGTAGDLDSTFLMDVEMVPVAAACHPLAAIAGKIDRAELERHVQLVLTGGPASGRSWGVIASRVWRFADLATRLSFLLAGLGWCNMPVHMVTDHLASGRLKQLDIERIEGFRVSLQVVHMRGLPPGPAGRWLIDWLRSRLGTSSGRLDSETIVS